MGFLATLGAAWLTASAQRQAVRDERMLEAKLRAFGECSESLYEYHRAAFNRVKARLSNLPHTDRDLLRQDAYRANTRARAAIGQVAILSQSIELRNRLEQARGRIGELAQAEEGPDLARRSSSALELISESLEQAQEDLMERPRKAGWWSTLGRD